MSDWKWIWAVAAENIALMALAAFGVWYLESAWPLLILLLGTSIRVKQRD